jgi:NAD(P)-dependent dehydrogenase (short-subunit alcohol dehydrogenase family)
MAESAAFADRIVVVTGAASGIGLATSRAFCEAGALVYMVDIASEAEGDVAQDNCRFRRCDVTDEDDVKQLWHQIDQEAGRVDVLVNNAGGFPQALDVESTSLDTWRRTIDLNLTSQFLMSRSALPLLRRSDCGRIINFGSLSGQTVGWQTSPPYVAAKAGVQGLTRVLADELASDGITVNTLAPSAVLTDRISRLRDAADLERTANSIPLKRYQSPDEVATWVLFLSSEAAGFMTGQTVSVNGGRFMA